MTDLYSNSGITKDTKIKELIKKAQYNPKKEEIKKTMAEELKELSGEICNTYDFKFIHLFIPPLDIYRKLCVSYDKTYLFIVSFIRVLIFLGLSKLYYDFFELKKDNNWETHKLWFLIIFIYACINILLLLLVIIKVQKYPKEDIK